MLASRLHPRRWDRPERRPHIDLRPGGSANLSGSSRRQHGELECPCANAPLRPQTLHERGNVLHFDGRVVTNRRYLGSLRQGGIEISLPARRIEALPIATRRRVIEHELDTRTNAAGGFGLGRPDRLEDADDMRRADVPDEQLADRRLRIRAKRCCPLRLVLRVLPRLLVLGDVLRGDFGECPLRQLLRRGGAAKRPTCGYWISYPPPPAIGVVLPFSRAAARVTDGKPPRPISCRRPAALKRRTQLRAPVAVTWSASPSTPPTLQRPGFISRPTSSGDISLALRGIPSPPTRHLPTNSARIVSDFRGRPWTTF